MHPLPLSLSFTHTLLLCPSLAAVPPLLSQGVRAWQGDFLDLPAFQGPASAITMNAVFGNFASPRDALIKAALLLRPGGHLLISHPMGRAWHAQLAAEQPGTVPHVLPDEAALQHATADLPLRLLDFRDEPQLYAALLQVCTFVSLSCACSATTTVMLVPALALSAFTGAAD